ncbi:hypothetical protein AKJ57_05270 [candidate division MSBL1 archaeon SCGC-AAA259A05]|uniref:N-acetyltransferase domain-containing protein n=1 Tax=candidate division MSBL1 archaeon SCGC-AAA259A05 TaxID=1698259 RepID=A0A133U5M0_9EURY|nr:hypothetical protein AKJ57_05270 [candidate division MSBL1 archaeon SCGC-AAA259A05]
MEESGLRVEKSDRTTFHRFIAEFDGKTALTYKEIVKDELLLMRYDGLRVGKDFTKSDLRFINLGSMCCSIMKNISFRKAERSDLNELMRLWEEFLDYNLQSIENSKKRRWMELTEDASEKSRSHFKNQIEQDDNLVLLAEKDNEIIGYIVASLEERPPIFKKRKLGKLNELFVNQDYRNEGLGKKLVENAKDWLKDKGVNLLKVRILEANKKANKFWKSRGFKNHIKP